jgi:predicted transcriptional regulator
VIAHVLEREMFSEAEVARLLRLSQSTLNYWLEGGTRRARPTDR